MQRTATDVTGGQSPTGYALGYTDGEQERLIRQAGIIAPITERLFREAGIESGQRVLGLGSGVGDAAKLGGRVVGASGEGVGGEGDANALCRDQAAGVR